MGVWQSAHWGFLRELLRLSLDCSMDESSQDEESGQQEKEQAEETGSTSGPEQDQQPPPLDQQLQKQPTTTLPDFLPAVIVQGHDWYLVITTQEEKRTVLWTKLFMGTTSSVLGIYQVAYALQLLRNWASRTYWPFLRQVVLDAGRRPTENQISASVPNT
jgi:hypothetical protein